MKTISRKQETIKEQLRVGTNPSRLKNLQNSKQNIKKKSKAPRRRPL
jgi:hypothetical protein